ncbi:hypothetical protein LINPERPRIM_LOCUS33954 [Linum perenne]
MAKSMAHYIIKQYLAAKGCLKGEIKRSNMYVAGSVKMIRCEMEVNGRRRWLGEGWVDFVWVQKGWV